jgi:NitT/TauT family transport system substrate-binding protein
MVRERLLTGTVVALVCAAVCITATAGAGTSAGTGAHARKLTNIAFNTGTRGVQYGDLYVALDKGFFTKQGLNVSFSTSGTQPATLLVSGAAQISSGTPVATYVPDAQGGDIVAVYSPAQTFELLVARDPDIKSPTDLKGKKVGVFSLSDLDVVYLGEILAQKGMSLNDVDMIPAGPTNAKLAAVEAGAVSAAFLYPPANFVGAQAGVHSIFPTSKLKKGQIPTFYIVKRSWASAHPNQVVALLRALDQAHDWLFNKKHKKEAIQILAKYTLSTPEVAEKSYDLFFTRPGFIVTKHGEWKAAAVKATAQQLKPLGLITGNPVPYAKTVNTVYLRAAYKQLYKKPMP